MFSPVPRRVEQKKTVFRHRLFLFCASGRALWGRALSQNRSRGGCAQIRCASALPPEARRAVGHAANLMGGGEKHGRRASTHVFSHGERGRRVLLLCAGERSRWAECGAQVRAAFFRKRSVIFGSGIGDVPYMARDRGRYGAPVAAGCSCPIPLISGKSLDLFPERAREAVNRVPEIPEAGMKAEKKNINNLSWLTILQDFLH